MMQSEKATKGRPLARVGRRAGGVHYHGAQLSLLLALSGLPLGFATRGATIWSGPMINFSNVPGSDPSQTASQDRLTANVWITRYSSQGIYNAKTEGSFTHSFSPQDTEWADGTVSNYSSLTYTDWDTWAKITHGGPPGTVGVNAVVHLISDDIYLNVKFTSWGGSGGGFSWQRSSPASAPVRLAVKMVGTSLDISWPAAGGRLQGQTNAPGAGLSTNWVTVSGSAATNHVVFPLGLTNASVFYRLAP